MTIRRRIRSAATVAGITAVVAALAVSPAHADDSFVKYYTVTTSYQGSPENLSEIATRFLGSQARSVEIFNLNIGREQADGKVLSDPAKLNPGWRMVLPWDAVGAGVQYGVLPTTMPTPAPSGSSNGGSSGNPKPPANQGQGGKPAVSPSAPPPATKPAGSGCATGTPAGKAPDWARQTVNASTAWTRSKGEGELVAVIDSGVDGSLTPLAGHVTEGVDVVSGNGRGDIDCLGTGTGMAAIIVAQPGEDGALGGVAPDAIVMPIRVVTTAANAHAEDEATAISVATASGATVIALGSYVDTADATVVAAIKEAVDHDVVVVCAAPAEGVPASAGTTLPPEGTLRVGGVGEDGQPIASYRPGSVDVHAPGGRVRTLGMTGDGVVQATGTQYAVAFVAGEAALIRSAYPNLPAGEVTKRVAQTVQAGTGGVKMMDPAAAVTAALVASDVGGPDRGSSVTSGTGRVVLLLVIGLVLLGALVLMVVRMRRLLRANTASADDEKTAPPPWPVPQEAPAAK
ncbi:S8 family serine peptidase [Micromonospora sp. WMMD1155]|uniref:S8 family serine peptidase n=1 Tax=Micromonospora sp. WMMD1155 TaxID=3016094 RepID=UPI00249CC0C3|nr:S8 family serine peptidase [Micromonospora sp. WMMD1155]WFE48820.1 S8 family serine peptidase [Micromonospora sp. WMMD1155]